MMSPDDMSRILETRWRAKRHWSLGYVYGGIYIACAIIAAAALAALIGTIPVPHPRLTERADPSGNTTGSHGPSPTGTVAVAVLVAVSMDEAVFLGDAP